MRLGQLARHLEISSKQIVDFLAQHQVEINDHPNVKLNEEWETMVMKHFSPEVYINPAKPVKEKVKVEVIEEVDEIISTPSEETQVSVDASEEIVVEEPAAESESITEELSIEVEATESEIETISEPEILAQEILPEPIIETESIEETILETVEELEDHPINRLQDGVIKAPKVELRGLKVVGKIELPQPKLKVVEETVETTSEDGEPITEVPVKTEVVEDTSKVRYYKPQRKNNRRPQLTPEQLEEKRIRSKKAKERREREQEERDKAKAEKAKKELKEQHYKEQMAKSTSAKKSIKKKKKSGPEVSQKPKTKLPPPKTLLGKFWRWLNT